jgi:hypothetical protein
MAELVREGLQKGYNYVLQYSNFFITYITLLLLQRTSISMVSIPHPPDSNTLPYARYFSYFSTSESSRQCSTD